MKTHMLQLRFLYVHVAQVQGSQPGGQTRQQQLAHLQPWCAVHLICCNQLDAATSDCVQFFHAGHIPISIAPRLQTQTNAQAQAHHMRSSARAAGGDASTYLMIHITWHPPPGTQSPPSQALSQLLLLLLLLLLFLLLLLQI